MAIYAMVLFLFLALHALTLSAGTAARQAVDVAAGISCLFTLWLLAALRIDTGTDYGTYVEIWDATPDGASLEITDVVGAFLEPLFLSTNIALRTIGDSPLLFFASYAAIALLPLHFGMRRLGVSQAYAYIVFFAAFYLPYVFNGLRQAVAMAIFVAAVPFFIQGRTSAVVLATVLAMGFHFSGALILPLYLGFRYFTLHPHRPTSVLVVGLCLGTVISFFGLGSEAFFLAFEYKREVYSEIFSEGVSPLSLAYRLTICAVMLWGMHHRQFPKRSRLKLSDHGLLALLNTYFVGIFLYAALADFNVLSGRINMFIRVLEVILIPAIHARMKGGRRAAYFVVTLMLLAAPLLTIVVEPDYKYQSVL